MEQLAIKSFWTRFIINSQIRIRPYKKPAKNDGKKYHIENYSDEDPNPVGSGDFWPARSGFFFLQPSQIRSLNTVDLNICQIVQLWVKNISL